MGVSLCMPVCVQACVCMWVCMPGCHTVCIDAWQRACTSVFCLHAWACGCIILCICTCTCRVCACVCAHMHVCDFMYVCLPMWVYAWLGELMVVCWCGRMCGRVCVYVCVYPVCMLVLLAAFLPGMTWAVMANNDMVWHGLAIVHGCMHILANRQY